MARAANKVAAPATNIGIHATADMPTQRLTVHEQTAWMRRSTFEE